MNQHPDTTTQSGICDQASWKLPWKRRLAGLVAAIGLGSALMMGCSSNSSDAEEEAKRAGQIVEIPSNSFALQWRADLPLREGTVLRGLEINDDRVFAWTTNNNCYLLSRESGFVQRIVEAGPPADRLFKPVTLPDRILFVASSKCTVLDKKTGKVEYTFSNRYGASSGAVGEATIIYFGENHPNGGRVTARDTKPQPYDIPPLWTLLTRGAVSATPALYQGSLFAGSRDGSVYAVRGQTRDVLWPGLDGGVFKTGGELLADLKADKEGVYVASVDTKLYCLKLDTGRVNWIYYAGRPLRETSSPVVTPQFVFLYVPDTGVVAIDKTGRQDVRTAKWSVPTGRQFLSHDERNVYLRNNQNQIIAVDKQSGQITFTSKKNDFALYAANTSDKDNHIYAATEGGQVLRIKPVLRGERGAGGGVGCKSGGWRRCGEVGIRLPRKRGR